MTLLFINFWMNDSIYRCHWLKEREGDIYIYIYIYIFIGDSILVSFI